MQSLPFRFIEKPVSPWGGLRLIEEFYRKSGLKDKLSSLSLPEPGSNRGYSAQDMVESFMVSVILGASRFSHCGNLKYDEVVSGIFGWKKGVASQSTFSRFFPKFDYALNDQIFSDLNRWWFESHQIDKVTIDVDSTVLSRYGNQDGVEVGYNPRRHGRGSHHPLIAFAAEPRMVIQSWMRSGNSGAATNFDDFFVEMLKVCPADRIGMVRGDSGFYSEEVIKWLETHELDYIISAKFTAPVSNKVLHTKEWHLAKNGIEYCIIKHKATGWSKERRLIIVRKDSEVLPKSGGKTLFPEYDDFSKYRYSAFVTNTNLSGELVWEIYKGRADAENQIKELKENYGINGFCSENMAATEAAFRWVMVAYNLMSLFKTAIIRSKVTPSLSTLKFQCIAIGSYLSKSSRKKTLILSAKEKRRDFFERLFGNLSDYKGGKLSSNA